ncbi:MAG: type II toxin-antitoxin system VapC family toxin [Thermomicrobiales bacterium]
MDVLLDTHVWLWTQAQPEKLGAKTQRLLTSPETRLHVSPVSTLEIARLVAGKLLAISVPLIQWVMDTLADLDAQTLPLTHDIAIAAYALKDFHKDPADRQLVATAQVNGLTLLTADERILDSKKVRSFDARL